MRVTSDIWVHVFVRREMNRGAFATIARKGAVEAGAIFILENLLQGELNLYGPIPQAIVDSEDDDRQFECVKQLVSQSVIDEWIIKQSNFDMDFWLVETECRQGPPSIAMRK